MTVALRDKREEIITRRDDAAQFGHQAKLGYKLRLVYFVSLRYYVWFKACRRIL